MIGACALPIDDSNDALQLSGRNKSIPWTHHPRCVVPSSVGLTDKFCVYSSSAFNGASGLSIIATPDTAAGLVAAVQDPLPAWRARRHLARRGHLQTETYDLPYTVVPIPGKGLGVVATRHIRQFETIMTSFPALIVDNVFFPPGESEGPAEGPALFQTALGQLTDKERFLTLSRSKGGDTHVVEDVVRTNSFGITLDGRGVKGLYPEIAKLNHACDPNAYSRFTRSDLAMSAVATRDIMPGEEITISYIPLGMLTAYRTRALRNWGFNCSCDLCAAPAEAREASDERRERLMEIYYAMQDESTTYDKLVEFTREFIELVQIERLLAKVSEYYQTFMHLYFNLGDAVSAQRYGKIALALAEIFGDPEGGFCSGLRRDLGLLEKYVPT